MADDLSSGKRSRDRRVEIDRTVRVFDGFFRIDESLVRYERFDGELTPTLKLLSFERGDAVAGVIVNTDTNSVLLVEQFRFPTYRKGDGWLVELVAGMIEPGEQPEDVMRREICEEMGYEVEHVEQLGVFYVSPGGSSERMFLFHAEVTNADRVASGGGLAQEGENVRIVSIPLEELSDALDEGRILDAKTIIGLMWLRSKAS
jgi:nudix-type nucleoside diphosphatase (YffH/AdpP family)